MIGGYADCLSRVKGNLHARFLGEGGQRCSALTRQITLIWLSDEWNSHIFFEGKIHKMESILASMTSVYFNKMLPNCIPEKKEKMPVFDCRVFQVPTEFEASNNIIWRQQDAQRNSVQMAARAFFGHQECENLSAFELRVKMKKAGIVWEEFPEFFRQGTIIRKRTLNRLLTEEEMALLPEKHNAKTNPEFKIKRTAVAAENNFPKIVLLQNREDVLLRGAEPKFKDGISQEIDDLIELE